MASPLGPLGQGFLEKWDTVLENPIKGQFFSNWYVSTNLLLNFRKNMLAFLEKFGNTFENCLQCILFFVEMKSFHLTNDIGRFKKKNQDFTQIKRFNEFFELMTEFVKPHLKGLDMNKPLSDKDPDEEIQAKRELYATFSNKFIADRDQSFKVMCHNEFSWDSPYCYFNIQFDREAKESFRHFHSENFLNKLNFFLIGVDYFDFYFPKPTANDGDLVCDNSPVNLFFHRLAQFWLIYSEEIIVNANFDLIQFFCDEMVLRCRFFDEDPSQSYEKSIIMVKILIKKPFDYEGITTLKSQFAINLWNKYKDKLDFKDGTGHNLRVMWARQVKDK